MINHRQRCALRTVWALAGQPDAPVSLMPNLAKLLDRAQLRCLRGAFLIYKSRERVTLTTLAIDWLQSDRQMIMTVRNGLPHFEKRGQAND